MKKMISWFLDNIGSMGYGAISATISVTCIILLYQWFGIIVAIVAHLITGIVVTYILDIIVEQEKAEIKALEHQKVIEDMNRRVNFYSEDEDEDK